MPTSTTEQEREDLNNTLKDIVTRRGKSVRIPELLEAELEELVDFILQRDAQRERIAERRGEVSQLQFLKHWATIHKLGIDVSDLDHFLKSLEQFPDQPLARENLEALSLPSPKPPQPPAEGRKGI